MSDLPAMLPPGSVVGILGGGQLGRMMAHAAARLGYKTHIFTPRRGSATQVTSRKTLADLDDVGALSLYARVVDVVTVETENIPVTALQVLADHGVPVRPGARALAVCQDRIAEKSFLCDEVGVETAPWRPAHTAEAVADAVSELGRPCILKTARGGYDGKGQVRIDDGDDPAEAFVALAGERAELACVVEGFVDFEREASVVVARGLDGTIAPFDLVENQHTDHILHHTLAPADVPAAVADRAREVATAIVQALDYVGVMGVELFVSADGTVRVNEMAPRPHNSGHWTLDACITDQFEQAIRAVVGAPLGSPRRLCDARMTNLLGHDVDDLQPWLADPHANVHLYGKTDVRPGRKMGHVTRLFPDGETPDGGSHTPAED